MFLKLLFMCTCKRASLCVCVNVSLSAGMYVMCVRVSCRGQKRELDPLKLKLQAVMNCLLCVLRRERGSSGRTTIHS